MLKYVQNGNDIWSPVLEKYVFLYSELGSICCYNIDCEEAKELEIESRKSSLKEYWATFLGVGGNIYDSLEWYKDCFKDGEKFKADELYDHALAFCEEYYNNNWIDCNVLLSTRFAEIRKTQ